MYTLKVESYFSSAHNLRGYKGKCEKLHGHNWKVEIYVSRKKLDKSGMVLDFQVLKARLNRVLEGLDHKYLNNIAYFKRVNPTSENIAAYIFNRLKSLIPDITQVIVWESRNCSASYDGK